MQVMRTKRTIVACNIFALGEYGNIMPASRNATKSRNFQGVIRAHYRSSIVFCHVTSSYSFKLASLRKYLKINSTEISSEILANYCYLSIYDNSVHY